MPSSTRLTIPSPCSQPWRAMTPDQQGRFCVHCQKTVVDFTVMTDAQIATHLQQTSGPSCGRFRSDQLNRTLVEPLNRRVNRWQWASLLLSGWLSSQAVQAQSGTEPNGVAVLYGLGTSSAGKAATESAKRSARITIEGRVISANERFPIPGALISVLNTDHRTSTDSAGLFHLTIPPPSLDSVIRLSVGYVFYVTQQLTIQPAAVAGPVLVELQEDTAGSNERFVVGFLIQKPTLWRRIRNWFKH